MKDPARVEVNDLLQIKLAGALDAPAYRCRVEDVRGDVIDISWPTERGSPVPVALGQELSLSFARDDAVYKFDGVIEAREREPIPHLAVRSRGVAERIQRRRFYRAKTAIPAEITGAIGRQADSHVGAVSLHATTLDLSGGGFCVHAYVEPAVGTVLEARLALPDGLPALKVSVRVVYCRAIVTPGQKHLNRIGLCFTAIPEADRKRLVRHINEVQACQLEIE